jgi:predicted PurR-regulated permease PerM
MFLFDVNKTLAAYARAQLISCVFIGVTCTTGFYIIGLNYAVLLGILAGVFEFVPLIGPLTIFVVAFVLAFLQSPWLALYTLIFLLILRLTHDYVTYPRIVRQGIHLHPLAIIFSVLAGEQVAGIPGVFLSIPIVALLTVFYKHMLEQNTASELFEGLLEPKKEEEKVIENV